MKWSVYYFSGLMKGVVVCVCVAKGGTMQMTTLEDLSIITSVF